jgi:hypothetical protein
MIHVSGFMIHVSGFMIHVSGFMIHVSGFMIHVSGFMIHVSGFMIHASGFMIHVSGFMIHISGFINVKYKTTDYSVLDVGRLGFGGCVCGFMGCRGERLILDKFFIFIFAWAYYIHDYL